MHSILKRSAALIASAATLLGGGMLMAGTAQADGIGLPVMTIHPAASTSYPKELVNGDFQTFGNRIVDKRSGGTSRSSTATAWPWKARASNHGRRWTAGMP